MTAPTQETLRARYDAAKLRHVRKHRQAQGGTQALGIVLEGFAETMDSSKPAKLAAHYAQLFCIAFAFITPVVLMLTIAL